MEFNYRFGDDDPGSIVEALNEDKRLIPLRVKRRRLGGNDNDRYKRSSHKESREWNRY